MDRFAPLIAHWEIQARTFDTHSAFLAHVTSRHRENEHRVAFWMPKAERWRFSPKLSEGFAQEVLREAQRDFRAGHRDMRGARHMLRVYAINVMPERWRKHRLWTERRKELRQVEALPSFGMF